MDSEIARHSAKSATTFRKAALIIAMAAIIYIDWDLGLALFAFYSAGPSLSLWPLLPALPFGTNLR